MSNLIDTIKWKLELGIIILIAIIQIYFDISATSWSIEIKILSGFFSILTIVFLYILVIFYVEITILKEDIVELKNYLKKK